MAFFSVRKKILISLLLITVLFGLGMVIFAHTVISHKLHDKLREKGIALAKRVAAECISPVITERYFEMTMMFKELIKSEKDIVYAFVLSEDGRELAHTFDKGFPEELRLAHKVDPHKEYSAMDLSTDKGRVHDIAVPLMSGQIGVLHIGFSDDSIVKDVNDIVMSIVLFSVIVLIAGTMASMAFSRTITRPLLRLTSAADAFGRGEMDHQVSVTSDDEIGELAGVFNEMVAKRKQAEVEKEQMIEELRQALSEVKTLRGFLPICAWCKKIRNDSGYWQQMEIYISEHSGAEFSHGICPECAKKELHSVIAHKAEKKSDQK